MAINLRGMPAISVEALHPVFGEGQLGTTFNRDVIVIIQINELTQFHVTGQRSGLMRQTLHQVTITDDSVGVMVDNLLFGLIESFCQKRFGNGHANPVGKALSQWPGGRFNSRGQAIFWVTGSFAIPLAETLQFFQG